MKSPKKVDRKKTFDFRSRPKTTLGKTPNWTGAGRSSSPRRVLHFKCSDSPRGRISTKSWCSRSTIVVCNNYRLGKSPRPSTNRRKGGFSSYSSWCLERNAVGRGVAERVIQWGEVWQSTSTRGAQFPGTQRGDHYQGLLGGWLGDYQEITRDLLGFTSSS